MIEYIIQTKEHRTYHIDTLIQNYNIEYITWDKYFKIYNKETIIQDIYCETCIIDYVIQNTE